MTETNRADSILRIAIILTGLLLMISGLLPLFHAHAAAPESGQVEVRLDSSQIVPRPLEERTGQSLVRQYSKAWQDLEAALNQNNNKMLSESFVGYAQDTLNAQIAAQKKAGLSTRYVDHGHKVDALIYSMDGSAVELRDAAQLEIQYLDGDKVVGSENTTRHYVVVMSVVDDGWKVRVLESAPNF
ncbi:MAG TPA: hypothetical protein VFZ99_03120 [Terriglobales bacterium]